MWGRLLVAKPPRAAPGLAAWGGTAIAPRRKDAPCPTGRPAPCSRAFVQSRNAAAVRSTAPQPVLPSPSARATPARPELRATTAATRVARTCLPLSPASPPTATSRPSSSPATRASSTPMPHAGRSTSPSRRPPPQRAPQGRRRRRRADACLARRPAGQGRHLPRGGICRPRRPVRGARAESGCHLNSRASRAPARNLVAPPMPPSPSRVRRSAKPVQAASTPVRARCAAASVPPRPCSVPPPSPIAPACRCHLCDSRQCPDVCLDAAHSSHCQGRAALCHHQATTTLQKGVHHRRRVCPAGALLPCLPSPCRVQGVRGNARTTSCINRAHQKLSAMLQRLSLLARFISARLVCGTLVLTHLFDAEDDGHKCW
jgi:hypothetical protein